MSIAQAILLETLYRIGEVNLPLIGLWAVQRPPVCRWIADIVPGDTSTGAVVRASISPVYLEFISAGGPTPADVALAKTLGVAPAMTDNLGADITLTLVVSIGLLGTLMWCCHTTFDSIFAHIGGRFVEKEQRSKVWIANILLSQIMVAVICTAPCSLAACPEATYTQGFITMLAGTPLKVFQITGGLISALGITITLQYIFKGESCVSLLIGFVVTACSGLTLLPLDTLSSSCAPVYIQVRYREGNGKGNIAEEFELGEGF